MKRNYDLSKTEYREGSVYALLKISLVQHVLARKASGLTFVDDGIEWHDIGKACWAWIASNSSLDVNEPVEERYDLFSAKSASHPLELQASVIKDKNNKYVGFLYDAQSEKLKYVRKFDDVEEAKATLAVLVTIDPEKEE